MSGIGGGSPCWNQVIGKTGGMGSLTHSRTGWMSLPVEMHFGMLAIKSPSTT